MSASSAAAVRSAKDAAAVARSGGGTVFGSGLVGKTETPPTRRMLAYENITRRVALTLQDLKGLDEERHAKEHEAQQKKQAENGSGGGKVSVGRRKSKGGHTLL